MKKTETGEAELFLTTKNVLLKVEQQVIRIETRFSWLNSILNTSFSPLIFLIFGVSEFFRPIKTWGILLFISFILALFSFSIISLSEEEKSYWLSMCFFLSVLLALYALPSSYAFDSIRPDEISQVKNFLLLQGVNTEEKNKLLCDNISLVKARVYTRVNSFKWLLGFSWALSLFMFNQFNTIMIKAGPDMIAEVINVSLNPLIIFGITTLFILCSIIGYKKANDAVFNRVNLALNELQYEISSNKKAPVSKFQMFPKLLDVKFARRRNVDKRWHKK